MDQYESALRWYGELAPSTDPVGIRQALADLERPCFIVVTPAGIGAVSGGTAAAGGRGLPVLGAAPPLPPHRLGAPAFRQAHGARYAYMAGAMANGIASVELVTALAREGFLASYGSACCRRRSTRR